MTFCKALLLFLLWWWASTLHADTISGRVIGVADGDTLTLLDAQMVTHKIRLAAIDAPEKHQAFGQRAKQALVSLVFNQHAIVHFDKRDRYQRIVGRVEVNGVDINTAQVQSGMAWVYRYYLKQIDPYFEARLINAEDHARENKIGLWAEPSPIPPWIFRRQGRS